MRTVFKVLIGISVICLASAVLLFKKVGAMYGGTVSAGQAAQESSDWKKAAVAICLVAVPTGNWVGASACLSSLAIALCSSANAQVAAGALNDSGRPGRFGRLSRRGTI